MEPVTFPEEPADALVGVQRLIRRRLRGGCPTRGCAAPRWNRDAGVLGKLLVTPTPRPALAGKAFAAGAKSLVQAVVALLIAAVPGVA